MKYLVFPVTVKDEGSDKIVVKSREGIAGRVVEAENYEDAHQGSTNHIPLFEGEQLAVVRIG